VLTFIAGCGTAAAAGCCMPGRAAAAAAVAAGALMLDALGTAVMKPGVTPAVSRALLLLFELLMLTSCARCAACAVAAASGCSGCSAAAIARLCCASCICSCLSRELIFANRPCITLSQLSHLPAPA
jgi:alkylhydroperoxidase family enzyme